MTGVRQDIVAALDWIGGLTVYPYEPDVITALQAWPVWAADETLGSCVELERWYVYVMLTPGSKQASAEHSDALRPAVRKALGDLGRVTLAEAWQVPIEPGGANASALRFTLEV